MMRMPRWPVPFLLLAFALMARAAVPPPVAALPAFPQAESDLRADPAATFGVLPNGVRYVILPNREPRGRASLRLLVLAGSFEETEAQRGLAHFLEHMAFNGSTHYPSGSLVETLQRLGMGFGADTNAATSFDHTIYQLELPDNRTGTLAEGLQICADYAGGLQLEPAKVDKERGIILSEMRTRDSAGYRTFVAQFDFLLGGTRIPQRLPIGLKPVINGAGRGAFADFYDAWYRPERLVVIVVGDVDAAAVRAQVSADFTGLKARAPARPDPSLGTVATVLGVRTGYHPEPESPDAAVSISALAPYRYEPDTAAHRLRHLPRSLAVAMINRRFATLAKRENAPFTRASAEVQEGFNFYREASIEVECKSDQWAAGLAVGDEELRRALEFGFTPDELAETVADFRNELEQAARTAATRRSDELAAEIADTLVDREVFTSPAQDLALYGPALSRLTCADCLAALRTAWGTPGRSVFVTGNARIPGDAAAAIAAAYARAEAVTVTAPQAQASTAWAYGDFGSPGAVASRRHLDDLDVTLVTFANGVRLNLKRTDFEANTIDVSLRAGSGRLIEPPGEPGLAQFASLTFKAGGLGRHSTDDLRRILAGRTVEAAFRVGGDACTLAGATNREDLALEFQLLAAHLADPGYRPEALRLARKEIEEQYLGLEHTLNGPLTLQVDRRLAGGDPRFGLPAKAVMLGYTLAQTRAWLTPQLQQGALEVAVVGDLDVEATIAAAARTFGALPRREPRPALESLRHVSVPAVPEQLDYPIESRIPKGLVAFYWPTTDALEIRRTRRLALLAEVLSDRLRVRVREQLGGTYSPSVRSQPSEIYPGYGLMVAAAVVDPAKAPAIGAAVAAVAADLSEHGISEDELARAKNPTLTSIRETERSNEYWLMVLGRAQEKPEVLDWCRTRRADFTAITAAELGALARRYLPPARAFRVTVHPAAESAAVPGAPAAGGSNPP
jgi:zinc protease